MKSEILSLLLACLLFPAALSVCAAGEAPPARFRISVESGYPSSLFYLIDNASAAPGGQAWPYYKTFWEKQFGISGEDGKEFAAYAAVREKYLLRPKDSRYRLSDKWPLIFAGAVTLEEAWRKADLYLADEDVAELRRVFAHFDAKFRPYWDAHAGDLRAAAEAFGRAGWDAKAERFLVEVARFYEVPAGLERDYLITLLWHPGKEISRTQHGTRLGRLMQVELPEGQDIAEQMDVVVHEMIHDVYEFMPERARTAAVSGMMKENPGSSGLFLQNLNEGMATALANGLFMARHLPAGFKPDGRWYAEKTVDSYAKAVYPAAAGAMGAGTGLGSCGGPMGAALRELAAGDMLPEQFRSHVLITSTEERELVKPLMDALEVNDVHYFSLDDAPRSEVAKLLAERLFRPVVLVGEPASLPGLLASLPEGSVDAAQAAELAERASERGLLAFRRGRSGRPFLFLLGGAGEIKASLLKLKDVKCCSSDFAIPLSGL